MSISTGRSISTWTRAVILACVSTNFSTGAVLSLATRSDRRVSTNTTILTSLALHLTACLVFTVVVVPVMSGAEENVLVLVTESFTSPVWCQAAFVLISVLGLVSVFSTLSVSLSFLHHNYQTSARLYPAIVGILAITISLSLLSFWSSTSAYSKELTIWTVERLSFLVHTFIMATIGWIVGVSNITGGQFGRGYTFYGLISPLLFLVLTLLIFLQDIQKRNLTVGGLLLVAMLCCIMIPACIVIVVKVREGKKENMPWREIWLQYILGRREKEVEDKSLTSSYRKFERCDQTFSNFVRMKSNQSEIVYKQTLGKF